MKNDVGIILSFIACLSLTSFLSISIYMGRYAAAGIFFVWLCLSVVIMLAFLGDMIKDLEFHSMVLGEMNNDVEGFYSCKKKIARLEQELLTSYSEVGFLEEHLEELRQELGRAEKYIATMGKENA